MSRAKTSHRFRRAKNARTGNQILLRKIGAALGRAAFRITCQSIERHMNRVRAHLEEQRSFAKALREMAQSAALVARQIRSMRGAQ